jgi:hypothetical protein
MNKKTNKILMVLLLFAFLNTAFTPAARAEAWGTNMASTIYQITTEKMMKSIYDTTLANLKMAALRIIQSRLMSLLQSSGIPIDGVAGAIISDWKMFIFSSATRYSDQITSDFFRGLSSGAAIGMQQRVINPAMMAVMTNPASLRPNLQNYVQNGDASMIFQLGKSMNPWVAWNAAAQPQNDLAYWTVVGSGINRTAYEQEAAAKQAEGQAGQGYAGKEMTASNGKKLTAPGDKTVTTSSGAKVSVPAGSDYKGQNITTTGSDIKTLANDVVIHMKTQMLSMAQSIPEIATAMVNQMISQVIQQGANQIANPGSGGMSSSQMMSQMTSQAQMLIQNGVRQAASPNTFFGR